MINDNWRDEVLALANSYCEAHGIMLTTLSARIVKDADFFDHLKNGGGCNVGTLEKVKHWFEANQPDKPKANAKHANGGT